MGEQSNGQRAGAIAGAAVVTGAVAGAGAGVAAGAVPEAGGYEIVFGVIQEAYSHTGVYIVGLTGGARRQVTRLGIDSDTPLGTREISQLTIG
ncbi:unnamed protein product, partial [marine sediment metagenome]